MANQDIIKSILNSKNRINVKFEWVKAHQGPGGDYGNERADYLATEIAKAQK